MKVMLNVAIPTAKRAEPNRCNRRKLTLAEKPRNRTIIQMMSGNKLCGLEILVMFDLYDCGMCIFRVLSMAPNLVIHRFATPLQPKYHSGE